MASAAITGGAIYEQLKHESGVHRVQRVPVTETQGRVHTSAASVVVMPQADEVISFPEPKKGSLAKDWAWAVFFDIMQSCSTLSTPEAHVDEDIVQGFPSIPTMYTQRLSTCRLAGCFHVLFHFA